MTDTIMLIICAVLLDWLLGEPRRFHPLVGFGKLAQAVEKTLHADASWRGIVALILMLAPFTCLAWWLATLPDGVGAVFSIWTLYFALGHKSLHDHVRPIVTALKIGDEKTAREKIARILIRGFDAPPNLPGLRFGLPAGEANWQRLAMALKETRT